jgi:hypothetical protein
MNTPITAEMVDAGVSALQMLPVVGESAAVEMIYRAMRQVDDSFASREADCEGRSPDTPASIG